MKCIWKIIIGNPGLLGVGGLGFRLCRDADADARKGERENLALAVFVGFLE